MSGLRLRIEETPEGFVMLYRDQRTGFSTPQPTRELAEGRAKRFRVWTHNDPDLAQYEADDFKRYEDRQRSGRRGGPWRWTLPDGTTGTINVSRKSDAQATLRAKRGTKQLPRGITWEVAR